MPEPIDKAKVLKYLTPRIKAETPYGEGYNRALEDAAELVALMPTIDPEVRHGRWMYCVTILGQRLYKCSCCTESGNEDEYMADEDQIKLFMFCPACGARMDGGGSND